MTERKGGWIETYSGNKFYPFDKPKPNEIHIVDIAHALSNICRYNGHCSHFYSVGQHSINVYVYLKIRHPKDISLQLLGLLHDASEAYISDICRPVKTHMPDYLALEDALQSTILEALAPELPSLKMCEILKEADDAVLYAEAKDLMIGVDGWVQPTELRVDTVERKPIEVKAEFLRIYFLLRGESHGL